MFSTKTVIKVCNYQLISVTRTPFKSLKTRDKTKNTAAFELERKKFSAVKFSFRWQCSRINVSIRQFKTFGTKKRPTEKLNLRDLFRSLLCFRFTKKRARLISDMESVSSSELFCEVQIQVQIQIVVLCSTTFD